MKKKNAINFSVAASLFVLFIVFTVLVKTVDVAAIGPQGSSVGLSSLNGWAAEFFGQSEFWHSISSVCGAIALLGVCPFAALGVYQLIKRKNLFAIDSYLLLLAAFYLIVASSYLFFELVIINYRPILEEGTLAASYPSSHTMLACSVMGSASVAITRIKMNKVLRIIAMCAAPVIALLTVIGRMLAGVHWFSDIVGGIILSAALVMLYYATICYIDGKSVRA